MNNFRFIDKRTGKLWVETAPNFKTAKEKIYKTLKVKPTVFTTKSVMNTWVIER